eukprot:1191887-Prorocentrum_minimum.AAC.4
MVTTPLPEAMESAYPPKGDDLLGAASIVRRLTPAPTNRHGQDARRRWCALKSRAYNQGIFFYDVHTELCAYVESVQDGGAPEKCKVGRWQDLTSPRRDIHAAFY